MDRRQSKESKWITVKVKPNETKVNLVFWASKIRFGSIRKQIYVWQKCSIKPHRLMIKV